MSDKIMKTDEEWRRKLAPEQYRMLRKKGTEPPFQNEFWDNHRKGIYSCAGCSNELFSSESKFESGTGWPSFWEPIRKGAVETGEDRSLGMVRTEVRCARCGGHIGHVFDDGPQPTGMRYCMNSGAMKFKERE